MEALSLAGFLIIGLTGSLHCAGMCGPIVWMMPFQHLDGARRWLAILLYHAGRIAAYCLLGALFFSLREAFNPRWQQDVALLSGALLAIAGAISFFGHRGATLLRPVSKLLIGGLARVSGRGEPAFHSITGFLNGLLPCGMVYMALAAAMKSADVVQGMISMIAFGAGTMPMLIAVTSLRRRIRFTAHRWTNALVVLFGVLVLLRGANLGIPYLSPERDAVAGQKAPAVNCCHKPR